MQWTSRIVVQIYNIDIPYILDSCATSLSMPLLHWTQTFLYQVPKPYHYSLSSSFVLGATSWKKAKSSIVSNRIVMEFSRKVPRVDVHRLTESDFGCDTIFSRWRPLACHVWRHWLTVCATVPDPSIVHSYFSFSSRMSQVTKIAVSAEIRNTGFGDKSK